MTDVVEVAKTYRAELLAGVAKMDDFIHMAERLADYDLGRFSNTIRRNDAVGGFVEARDYFADLVRTDAPTSVIAMTWPGNRGTEAGREKPVQLVGSGQYRTGIDRARDLAGRYGEAASHYLEDERSTAIQTLAVDMTDRASSSPALRAGFKLCAAGVTGACAMTMRAGKAASRYLTSEEVEAARRQAGYFVATAYSNLTARNRIERRFHELKSARELSVRYERTASRYLGFKNIASIRMWSRDMVSSAYSNLMAIGLPRDQKEPQAQLTTAGRNPVTIEAVVRSRPSQLDLTPSEAIARTSAALRAKAGWPADKTTLEGRGPLLVDVLSNDPTPVDIHVGQRLRHRRWMMGMTQQQLAERIGIESAQVRKYESGAIRIGASRMWEIAAVLDVPVSFLFDGLEGQAQDSGDTRGDVLSDSEAGELVRAYCSVPEEQRKQLIELARELSTAA